MPPVAPVPAYISALIVAIGNAAVAFGAFNNTVAASVESAVVGVIALGFVIANALHHKANAAVTSAKLTAGKP
jgi:hypothetical protein